MHINTTQPSNGGSARVVTRSAQPSSPSWFKPSQVVQALVGQHLLARAVRGDDQSEERDGPVPRGESRRRSDPWEAWKSVSSRNLKGVQVQASPRGVLANWSEPCFQQVLPRSFPTGPSSHPAQLVRGRDRPPLEVGGLGEDDIQLVGQGAPIGIQLQPCLLPVRQEPKRGPLPGDANQQRRQVKSQRREGGRR